MRFPSALPPPSNVGPILGSPISAGEQQPFHGFGQVLVFPLNMLHFVFLQVPVFKITCLLCVCIRVILQCHYKLVICVISPCKSSSLSTWFLHRSSVPHKNENSTQSSLNIILTRVPSILSVSTQILSSLLQLLKEIGHQRVNSFNSRS